MDDTLALVKIACTVAVATATVIGTIAKPLWSKLNQMSAATDRKLDQRISALEVGLDAKRSKMEERIDDKLSTIGETTEGIRSRVGEQNGRIGKIETWCEMHESLDDERHVASLDSRKEVVNAVNALRERLT